MNHDSTILIVDDEPAGRETLEALLFGQGYNLAFADSGEEALAKAAELVPDLIMLDVMMHGLDGFEVCRRLRADPLLAEIPIIMVTALDDRGSRLHGIEARADDFVSKPLDRVELRARVRTITRLDRYRRLLVERSQRQRAEEEIQRRNEQLRALAARLAETEEAKRKRIARDLHDQVGQNLTALGINLNIVRSQMPEDAPDRLRSRLDDSLALVEQMDERIRDVMADLRPPVLDDYGLVAALRWHGEQFASRVGITVSVEGGRLDPRLDTRVENALFRIAQEALTNVAKHAQAEHATVTVKVDGETVRLVVADDGVGFDVTRATEADKRGGWGLLTMAERAEAVGGRYRIETHPSQGTRVIVEVER